MRATVSGLLFISVLQVGEVWSSTLYQWIVDSQTRFNYDPNPNNMLGVYNWPRTYSEDCGGTHQSPVDIQTDLVQYGVSCQCPRLIYPSNILHGMFKNNGHSAEFEPQDDRMLQLTSVPYRSGMYKLHDFHLHYGGVTGREFELQGLRFRGSGIMSAGSEHTIDGLRFEGELHFVFYNSDYKDLEDADNKTDGVVVIVVLIQKLGGIVSDSGETSRFSEFLETNIPRIFPYQMNVSTEIDLSIFFNRDCEFYTYQGSTTTPTCHESVRWIILKDPIMVTERAWFTLTGLQSRGDFNSRFGNYRTTQPLNDRIIEANFERPNRPVLPSPNGDAVMMMMMDVMNMTMDMLNQGSNMPNIPTMLRERNELTSQGSVRDMPLMMMSILKNANVPNLNGNVRNRPMLMMPIQSQSNLNGNIRDMQMMMRTRLNDPIIPNVIGNVGDTPMGMTQMQRDTEVPNLKGSDMPMMMPTMMQTRLNDINIPRIGNVQDIRMMMPMQMYSKRNVNESPASIIPIVQGSIQDMPAMMARHVSIPNLTANITDSSPTMFMSMQREANVPNLNGNVRTMSGMFMTAAVNRNLPNLNGNVRGRSMVRMPHVPIFDGSIRRMMSLGIGRRGNIPNQNANVRGIQTSEGVLSSSFGGQPSVNRGRNNVNNNNDEKNNDMNHRNRDISNNRNQNNMNVGMASGMIQHMQNPNYMGWNVWK